MPMNGRFEFEGAEVRALVEESRSAKERLLTEAQQWLAAGVDLHAENSDVGDDLDLPETGAPPGLWLMNDRGVYLRSNAKKRNGDSVAYARGYRADIQVGDEAVCEFIDAAPLEQLQPADTLVVTLSEEKLRMSIVRQQ
jgi:hypothetical protein